MHSCADDTESCDICSIHSCSASTDLSGFSKRSQPLHIVPDFERLLQRLTVELSNNGQGPLVPLPAGSACRSHGIYDGKLIIRYLVILVLLLCGRSNCYQIDCLMQKRSHHGKLHRSHFQPAFMSIFESVAAKLAMKPLVGNGMVLICLLARSICCCPFK